VHGHGVTEPRQPEKRCGGFVTEDGVRVDHRRRIHPRTVPVPGSQCAPFSAGGIDTAADECQFTPGERTFGVSDVSCVKQSHW
jgi:hypothetical protein